jgi:hypothetical protein
MRCAVCNLSDNVVTNVIMADPNVDPAPYDTFLVGIQDGVMCDIGWIWDGSTFINPNPPEPEIPLDEEII